MHGAEREGVSLKGSAAGCGQRRGPGGHQFGAGGLGPERARVGRWLDRHALGEGDGGERAPGLHHAEQDAFRGQEAAQGGEGCGWCGDAAGHAVGCVNVEHGGLSPARSGAGGQCPGGEPGRERRELVSASGRGLGGRVNDGPALSGGCLKGGAGGGNELAPDQRVQLQPGQVDAGHGGPVNQQGQRDGRQGGTVPAVSGPADDAVDPGVDAVLVRLAGRGVYPVKRGHGDGGNVSHGADVSSPRRGRWVGARGWPGGATERGLPSSGIKGPP